MERRKAITAGLALAAILPLTGCLAKILQTGLDEQDAQEIVVLLKENGIDATAAREAGEKKESSSWTVKLKGGDQTVVQAWRVLRENGLPKHKDKGLSDVF
ncbi:MAG: hypothetical protein ACRD8O_20345, partial [Bryobacteraceae bacterium]